MSDPTAAASIPPSDGTTTPCAYCREPIVAGALVCPKCRMYQRAWRNWLQLGLIVAGLVGYGTGFLQACVRRVTWRDDVRVVRYKSEGPSAYLNTGSGPIYLSEVVFKIGPAPLPKGRVYQTAVTAAVNVVVPAGEVMTTQYDGKPWRNALVRTPEDLEKALTDKPFQPLIFDSGNPSLAQIKDRDKGLLTLPT